MYPGLDQRARPDNGQPVTQEPEPKRQVITVPIGGVRVIINPAGIADLEAVAARITRDMAHDIAQDARRRVPVDTGELKSTIRTGAVSPQHWRVWVGTEHWAPTEYGSAPHIIRSTGPWPLRNRETGEVFGPVVHHPGTPAQPFMRPAAYTKRRPRTT